MTAVALGLTLAWLPVLAAGLYWDDAWLVSGPGNPTSAGSVWTRDLWGDGSTPFYRPVLLLSLWFDRVSGVGTVGAHLQSLLWHVGTALLLQRLVARRAGEVAGLGAALIFGLHPVQSEAVAWLSARSDPLCAFWGLAALLALEVPAGLPVAALAACLAACSKEQGLLLPLVFVAWRLAWRERLQVREILAVSLGVGAAWALRSLAPIYDGPPDPASLALFAERWPIGPSTLLAWLVVPWPLTGTASLYAPFPGPWAAAALGVLVLTLLGLASGRRGLLVLLALVLLIPGVAAMRASVQIGERLLYFPLVFLAAAAGPVLAGRPWRTLAVLAAVLLVPLELRLPDWRDTERLEARALAHADDPFTWHWVGALRAQRGDVKGAFDAHLRAVRGQPPMVWSCAEPVRLLLQADAKEPAARLVEELRPTCGGRASFEEAAAATR